MAEILPEANIRALALDGGNLVPRKGSDADVDAAYSRLQRLVADTLLTVNHVDISAGHRTAACNLLCTVISQCSQSPIEELRSIVWQNQTWLLVFDVVLTQSGNLSVKPVRQLLTGLTSALDKCQDASVSNAIKETTIARLVGVLCSTTEHVPIRPAMQSLSHFLTKKIVSTDDIYDAICAIQQLSPNEDSEDVKARVILESTLRWAPYDDYSSPTGLLASAVLESFQKANVQNGNSTQTVPSFHANRDVPWVEPVLKVLANDPSRLENYRHYMFPELFKHSLQDFIVFLERVNLHYILGNAEDHAREHGLNLPQEQMENILFCALSVGSKTGSVQVAESSRTRNSASLFFTRTALCIPDTLLGSLLLRTSATVRVAGLSMLISSNTTTKPLSMGTIRALKSGLSYLHAEADAGFRSEMLSLVRNLTDRLKDASRSLFKLSTRQTALHKKGSSVVDLELSPQEAARLLETHKRFLEWYISFLKMDLRPNASYQRHISAVKCIALICRSGVDPKISSDNRAKTAGPKASWPFQLDVIDDAMTGLLLDLLLDPYDDVRQGAAEILSIAPTNSSANDQERQPGLVRVLRKAEHMAMLSGRADQADGVAHLYTTIFSRCSEMQSPASSWWESKLGVLEHLVGTLENTLRIAAEDMSNAVSKHPLHGIFISIRYIMDSPGFYKATSSAETTPALHSLHLRLYQCFESVWSCVKDTLCNDAPEGHVPDELDEEDDVGTKDVLSYSWRALKEASLLMRSIVKSCPFFESTQDNALMNIEQLRNMGDLSFTQLAELRHRGAFATVATTFATCCLRCNTSPETTRKNIQEWYHRALSCIRNQTTINTRRSAGLPSLMVGIVLADENRGDIYAKAMRDLTVVATKSVDSADEQAGGLSQVHALNCLKDMFRNSKLGERSEAHVPEALGLAANCLSSETWAIRNSGLMLFRALLDRLLGTNDSYINQDTAPQSRLSFAAVPNLMEVIFRLISPPLDTTKDLLTEGVFPALQLLQRTPPPPEQRQKVQDAVLRLTASPQWHIRDKAARTYAVMTAQSGHVARAIQLISIPHANTNTTHGALLSARYILQSYWVGANHDDLRNVAAAMCEAADRLYHASNCPFTKMAFVDLYHDWCLAAYTLELKHDEEREGGDNILQDTETTTLSNDVKLPLSAPAELEALLHLKHIAFVACSALRQSLAHATLQEAAYLRSGVDSLPMSSLLKLAHSKDADACAAMLAEAAKLCISSRNFRTLAAALLTALAAKLLFDDNRSIDIEVQAAAQDVLLALLDSEQAEKVQGILRDEVQSLYLPINAATPLFQNKRMVLQGALLELRFCGAEVAGRSLPDDFAGWVTSLKPALHEENPFDTRLAAADAVARIKQGLATITTSPEYSSSFLTFALAVYDLTNDDDDEVRNLAASTACQILSITHPADEKTDLIPLPAGARLAETLATRYNNSNELVDTAVFRLSGGAVGAHNVVAVEGILAESKQQDTALFVQEKQNLFIDDAREARLWSQLLTQLSLSAASKKTVAVLSQWTTQGLETVLSTLDAGADGPLGWKRRPEVFVLGLRVIYAAEALLLLAGRSKKVKVPTIEIRAVLVRLLVEGRAKEMHPLLVEQIERVSRRAIVGGVGRVGGIVCAVQKSLE